MSYDTWMRSLVRNGQGFWANGRATSSTNNNLTVCALSLFNPSNSGKTMYVYSLETTVASSGTLCSLRIDTTDPNGSAGYTQSVPVVHMPGLTNPASVASACMSAQGTSSGISVSASTTVMEAIPSSAVLTEWLLNGVELILPPGNGLQSIQNCGVAGGYFQASAKWVEV